MKIVTLNRLLAVGFAAAISLAAVTAQAADEKKPPSMMAPNPAAGAAAPKVLAPADRLDINSASEAQLTTLTGIGEARAKAIIKGRPYSGKDDLVEKADPQSVYDNSRPDHCRRSSPCKGSRLRINFNRLCTD